LKFYEARGCNRWQPATLPACPTSFTRGRRRRATPFTPAPGRASERELEPVVAIAAPTSCCQAPQPSWRRPPPSNRAKIAIEEERRHHGEEHSRRDD
jgi:hypothetical protein